MGWVAMASLLVVFGSSFMFTPNRAEFEKFQELLAHGNVVVAPLEVVDVSSLDAHGTKRKTYTSIVVVEAADLQGRIHRVQTRAFTLEPPVEDGTVRGIYSREDPDAGVIVDVYDVQALAGERSSGWTTMYIFAIPGIFFFFVPARYVLRWSRKREKKLRKDLREGTVTATRGRVVGTSVVRMVKQPDPDDADGEPKTTLFPALAFATTSGTINLRLVSRMDPRDLATDLRDTEAWLCWTPSGQQVSGGSETDREGRPRPEAAFTSVAVITDDDRLLWVTAHLDDLASLEEHTEPATFSDERTVRTVGPYAAFQPRVHLAGWWVVAFAVAATAWMALTLPSALTFPLSLALAASPLVLTLSWHRRRKRMVKELAAETSTTTR